MTLLALIHTPLNTAQQNYDIIKVMKTDSRGNDYERWELLTKMRMDTDLFEMFNYKDRRRPLPADKQLLRYNEMKKLHDDGAPYAWIAKVYRLNRSQVRRIILNLGNHGSTTSSD